ncbi:MAG: hypothetical protein ACRDSJ_21865 [Rubrobacteraceae bacterium]
MMGLVFMVGIGKVFAAVFAGKVVAAGGIAAMVGAVAWPVVQNWKKKPKDSFPLSYYPMFSVKRSETAKVQYLLGVGAGGERRLLPYTYAGDGGFNQVRRQIRRMVREGDAGKLCERVASGISANGRFSDVETGQVVTGEDLYSDYFAGKKEPLSEKVHASRKIEKSLA